MLISDIGMPDADGYEFIRPRENSRAAHARFRLLPAIAVTAYARP